MTKVKAEELDKALEKSESFEVNLQDIPEVKTERQLGEPFWSVQWNATEKPKALLYRTGMVSGFQGLDDWVRAIQDSKGR